ncbi:hypothetical protein ACP70R_011974 [Stipagrostis hirtigluma subsp. patula]
MEAQNMEVSSLVQKIAGLHAAIAKLPSLSPSPEVDALFTAVSPSTEDRHAVEHAWRVAPRRYGALRRHREAQSHHHM